MDGLDEKAERVPAEPLVEGEPAGGGRARSCGIGRIASRVAVTR